MSRSKLTNYSAKISSSGAFFESNKRKFNHKLHSESIFNAILNLETGFLDSFGLKATQHTFGQIHSKIFIKWQMFNQQSVVNWTIKNVHCQFWIESSSSHTQKITLNILRTICQQRWIFLLPATKAS